ncbi:glycosyl transferase family 1 [Frigoribacterium sp. PhB107]|uniref:glycosyltransferase n=1 Tax=Frigoribacterium sp. PhB107 TaxID=2485172 RepID=UPI000F4AC7A9|nr:glycosyltransferase [Frigoribacterium sp. PhB107]ROP73431.1 glycosyl transferase family 1 [Frigoribacterium sp. PhB107]
MKILLWHVHGGWADAFVRGRHEYLLPTTPAGGPWGLGRAGRDWPENVREVHPDDLRDADVDLVVLQRTDELAEAERFLGRRLGTGAGRVPAVFVEHNAPRESVPNSVHPLSGRDDVLVAHVTAFNSLFWDCGDAPTVTIEHGVVDPGPLYTGERARLGVVVNEPVRRWRITGSDLLPRFAEAAPLDVFGMGADGLPDALGLGADSMTVVGDLPTARLHRRLSECRVYLHPIRWTSLGLSLIEAMQAGMPVVALATTEAYRAVPARAGAVSTDLDVLVRAARELVADPDAARAAGEVARAHALERYGLGRFLAEWDAVLEAVIADGPRAAAGAAGTSTSTNERTNA